VIRKLEKERKRYEKLKRKEKKRKGEENNLKNKTREDILESTPWIIIYTACLILLFVFFFD